MVFFSCNDILFFQFVSFFFFLGGGLFECVRVFWVSVIFCVAWVFLFVF